MAVGVDYSLENISPDVLPFLDGVEDGFIQSNGRLILTGPAGGQVGALYETSLSWADTTMPGIGGSIAYFNSTYVLVSDVGTDISFRFTNSTGVAQGADHFLGESGSDVLNPEIAGNYDGFAIVYQDVVSGSDHNLKMSFHDSAGNQTKSFAIDASTANDRMAQIAAVGDEYVVAWQRNGGSELWYAVYDSDGDVIVTPSLLDADGAVNRDVSIIELHDGTFALAYEDSGWSINDSDIDVTVMLFDENFLPINAVNATLDGADNLDPSIAQLQSGHLLVSFTSDDGTDTDISLVLLEEDGDRLEFDSFAGGAGDQSDSFVFAPRSGLDLRIVHADSASGDLIDTTAVMVRTTKGDAANNVIVADRMVDHINAGDGADTISGYFLDDELNGEGGADVFLIEDSGHNFDLLDGGEGIDTLRFVGGEIYSHSFLFSPIRSIEVLEYGAAGAGNYGEASFYATQIGGDGISSTATVLGSDDAASSDRLTIRMSSLISLDLSGFTVEDFDDPLDLIEIVGGNLAETITGTNANDTFSGVGGADNFTGLAGNDTFRIYDAGAVVTELAGGGTADKIITSISYTLATSTDIEILQTNSSSSTAALDLTGNLLAQEIIGNYGANRISAGGIGGAADLLRGLSGDDHYLVYNAADAVQESSAQGAADRISAAVSYTLASNVHVEMLTTTSSTGVDAIDLTGNLLTQEIVGNYGANRISAGGIGGAADLLRGLSGDDHYLVYNAADAVQESSAQGAADRVSAAVSYALAANVHVEMLTTTSSTGTAAINLTGNVLAQEIVGNYGDNTLHDGGAGAADTLRGLSGNDTYRIFNSGDTIVESSAQGAADRVMAAVNYTLQAGVYVETIQTNGVAGTSAINLTGNEVAQTIIGNDGDNRLEGKGGSDTLRGYAGADTYVFATTPGAGNIDTIVDFNAADDRFLLSDVIFTALTPGTLSASQFRSNLTGLAGDADDRIIYNSSTGSVFYDADGTGAAAGIQFATVSANLAITEADFSVA